MEIQCNNNILGCVFHRQELSLNVHSVDLKPCKFGILKYEMDINIADLPYVIYACFVLHNYCELEREPLTDEDITRAVEYKREFQPSIVGNRYSLGNNDEAGIFVKYFD